MNTTLAFDFSIDKVNRKITIKREFAADLPLVWDAYTKSEILDQWWASKPWKAKTKSMNFQEGGRWLYAMVGPQGEEHWAVLDYKKIIPKKGFTAIDAFSDADGNINKDLPGSHWEQTFTDKGDVTLVTGLISYETVEQLEAIIQMGFKEGITMAMEGLDELLPALKKARAK